MSEPAPEELPEREHQVTPLELFFDLVFVFAITQVTALLSNDPTWHGAARGALVLAAVWWAWTGYAWLTSTLDVDEGGVRLAMLAALAAMLAVALAVPGAFGDDAVLFGVAFLVVRILHVVLYAIVARGDPRLLGALFRLAPTELGGALLLVGAGLADGDARLPLWLLALAVDYLGPAVVGLDGWRIAPEHFAERHGLVILIALGESVIAIGAGGLGLSAGVMVGAMLGAVVISALWWLYFDVAAIFVRTRLLQVHGVDQMRFARDSYSYLHLPMVAGVVFFAFGLETTLHHVHDSLDAFPATALCGGAALYLVGHIAFLLRSTRRLFRRRTIGAIVLLVAIPVAGTVPAIAALSFVAAVCVSIVAYEALRYRAHRVQVRHPELAGF